MRNALILVIPILIVGIVLVVGAMGTSADKGGCPNGSAANGALHANAYSSAHGTEKMAARGCD